MISLVISRSLQTFRPHSGNIGVCNTVYNKNLSWNCSALVWFLPNKSWKWFWIAVTLDCRNLPMRLLYWLLSSLNGDRENIFVLLLSKLILDSFWNTLPLHIAIINEKMLHIHHLLNICCLYSFLLEWFYNPTWDKLQNTFCPFTCGHI